MGCHLKSTCSAAEDGNAALPCLLSLGAALLCNQLHSQRHPCLLQADTKLQTLIQCKPSCMW
jgi:hypothetical protein